MSVYLYIFKHIHSLCEQPKAKKSFRLQQSNLNDSFAFRRHIVFFIFKSLLAIWISYF